MGCERDGYRKTGYTGEENIKKDIGPVVEQGL
jgi:hypothetical protein